jgi:hypothetical protein
MKWLRLIGFVLAVVWSAFELVRMVNALDVGLMTDSHVAVGELCALANVIVFLVGVWVVVRSIRLWMTSKHFRQVHEFLNVILSREALAASALVVIPNTSVTASPSSNDLGIPVRALIEPAVAIALLRRLLSKQRVPSAEVSVDTRLTDNSANSVNELRRYAIESLHQEVIPSTMSVEDLDAQLRSFISVEPAIASVVDSWDIVLRLYGFPYVESRNGVRASFAKKRSVEVLAWLGMNMDRPRRSAVRTAVWDIEISDASFSTVMSDIRRGIGSVTSGRKRDEIFPPTFSDHIEVGVGLITDFDLLQRALKRFRNDETAVGEVIAELKLIRDIPFAGVNYMWADLDGTTTRMVLLALQASCEVAEWARNKNDVDTCAAAVKAGLRVMPGHEELLAIQNSFISQRSMSQG